MWSESLLNDNSDRADLGVWPYYDADTNRVRADSGLPHVSLLRAQVGDLHSQSGRQGLHVTCQPGEGGGNGNIVMMDKPTWCTIQYFIFPAPPDEQQAATQTTQEINENKKKTTINQPAKILLRYRHWTQQGVPCLHVGERHFPYEDGTNPGFNT